MISDVRMPGSMDGLELLTVVRETLPTLPVIIAAAPLWGTPNLAEGACQFIGKPYSMEVVIKAVRAELAKAA